MVIKKYNDLGGLPSVKMLVYGKSGTGKTYSLHSLGKVPDFRKILVINVDNKLYPLIRILGDKDYREKFEFIDIESFDDYLSLLKYFREGKFDYDVVVVDSFSLLQTKISYKMQSLLEDASKRLVFYDKLYKYTIASVDKLCEVFKDSVIIFILLEDIDIGGKFSGELMLSGKSKSVILSRFDLVMYSRKEGRRYLWVINDESLVTKILPGLEDISEFDQDYEKLFMIINNSK